MDRLLMNTKQAFGALYAIQKYLDSADEEVLNMEVHDSYGRGVRAGSSDVIESITKIMNKYQSRREN